MAVLPPSGSSLLPFPCLTCSLRLRVARSLTSFSFCPDVTSSESLPSHPPRHPPASPLILLPGTYGHPSRVCECVREPCVICVSCISLQAASSVRTGLRYPRTVLQQRHSPVPNHFSPQRKPNYEIAVYMFFGPD
ncbi:hypothetical protein H1C71_026886 [Ictidomys tridecemlineatus]|nr:hypothetical protein H1C71_026886 [Ictidomys tridecemlineatus]